MTRTGPAASSARARSVGSATLLPDARLAPTAALGLAPDDLALFVLNVGDGDALVLRFPSEGQGAAATMSYAVIDGFDGDKTIALLEALGPGPIRVMLTTHPHSDQIKALEDGLLKSGGPVPNSWDSASGTPPRRTDRC